MDGNIIRLYHGTILESAFDIAINGIDLSKSEKYLDFGAGFYLTNDRKRAAERAWKKASMHKKRYNINTIAYIVEVGLDVDIVKTLNVKKFPIPNDEWKLFVLSNRLTNEIIKEYNIIEHNRDSRYDIVEGDIADGSISEIAFSINCGSKKMENIDMENMQQILHIQITYLMMNYTKITTCLLIQQK